MGRSREGAELVTAYDAGVFSFKNKLINAEFLINQRAYSSGAATSGANQYTLDRWKVVTSGQNVSWTTSENAVTVTAPAGGLEQVIESFNLVTGTYVLNWTGTATATVGGNSVSKGGTVSVTGGSNLTIRFSNGTLIQPQFELGLVPTPFEHRFYGLELALCERYYQRWGGWSLFETFPIVLIAWSTSALAGPFAYKRKMRDVPDLSVANIRYLDGVDTFTGGSVSLVNRGFDSAEYGVSSLSGLTQYRPYYIQANNSTSGVIALSAEL